MDQLTPNPDLYMVPWATNKFHDMPYRRLGRSGLQASNIGLGTWKMGYPDTGDGARLDGPTSLAILDRAMELGVTFWDTANRYNGASGNSERIIGTWLAANGDQRRNVVLATKIRGGMDGRSPNHGGLSRANIFESVYACMQRLQVDYIDVLYFHAFDELTPPEESLAAIEDLVRRDVVRYFAVSNFTVAQLELYRAIEQTLSVRCRVIAVQNRLDILSGQSPVQPGVLEHAARAGLSFVAYSPLARGLLTNRYLDPTKAKPGDRLYDEGTLEKDTPPAVLTKLRALADVASQAGLELNQLAIAYMLSLPGMGPVIAAPSNIAQLESNAAAGTVTLSNEQLSAIRTILDAPADQAP